MGKDEKVAKGYYIRTIRDGNRFDGLQHAWGIDGEMPEEWPQVQQDPLVTEAQIFSSTQRNRRGDKRKIIDSYQRDSDTE